VSRVGDRVRVVLQARLSSSRLPAKALLEVAGRPLVVLAAQRAGSKGHEVVVATSTEPEDDAIERAVEDSGLVVHRGSLHDPLDRFVTATADLGHDDVVVRLTSDNVFPDGELIEQLVSALTDRGLQYARVGGPRLPYGVSAEAVRVGALREAAASATEPADREHVTPWVRRTHGDNLVDLPDVHEAWHRTRCTVDTFDDFVAVEAAFASVTDPVGIGWRELSDRLAPQPTRGQWPERPRNSQHQTPVIVGTAQLGLEYGVGNTGGLPSAERASEVLGAVARAGISHVDTARAYGSSEERIGAALRAPSTHSLRVVTKLRPLELPDDADPEWSRAAVSASLGQSLVALGVRRVDAVLAHRASDWAREPVRQALADARDSGLCDVVGVSVQSPDELLSALEDTRCGYVQLPFNLLDRRWLETEVQEALQARPDLVVTARSVFLQGLLTVDSAEWPSNVKVDSARIRDAIAELVTRLGRESPADLCLAYVLGHDWVTSAVVGVETPDQVDDLARLGRRPPLSPDEIELVREHLPAGPADLVDPSRWRPM
jgi:spore coat polysaccharide biosynthesis protein SpsF (cytidylyltransferase family)/aryl-alcohol dehydrogenase-like predicted oxidoreductase